VEYLDVIPPTVSFDPTDGAMDISTDTNITITFNEAVRNIDNSELTNDNIDALITLKETDDTGNPISFDATINAEKTVITIDPVTDLNYDQDYYVAIGETVEDVSDNAITFTSATFTTKPVYTVTYNGNTNDGGTVPTDGNDYIENATVTVLDAGTLTKAGYAFSGWNTLANGTGVSYASGDTFTMGSSNVTLYAQWTALPTYSVTYKGNGSDGGIAPTDGNDYLESATVTVLDANTLTRTGYAFSGWNTLANGAGTSYASGDTFTMGSSNVTLYAQWTANMHRVQIENSGDVGIEDILRLHGTDINDEDINISKAGHTLEGYYTEETFENKISFPYTIIEDIILYAKWTPNKYTITFEANGGSSVSSITEDYNTTIQAQPITAKDDYVFEGWYTDQTLTDKAFFPYTIMKDTILYAKWTENPTNIFFDSIQNNSVINISHLINDIFTLSGRITPPSIKDLTIDFGPGIVKDLDDGIVYDDETGQWTIEYDRQEMIDNIARTNQAITIVVTDIEDRVRTHTAIGLTMDFEGPEVSGVIHQNTYSRGTILQPTFGANDTATLNGIPYQSGTEISGSGNYELIVTDEAGNSETFHFTIRSKSSSSKSKISKTVDAEVTVNGQSKVAGKIETSQNETKATIKLDESLINEILSKEKKDPTIQLPVVEKAETVVGSLNGKMIKDMEAQEAVLKLNTKEASYTLPTTQIQIEDVSKQFGEEVELKDIDVKVEIGKTPSSMVKVVQNTAEANTFSLVVPPVDFKISCTYKNETVNVNKFNAYVERTITIPENVDASKITTGLIVYPDGTTCHVPTQIIKKDGKYYARINSLTNSTYSVIWNPKDYLDVKGHWGEAICNEMGSRMIVEEESDTIFKPDEQVNRVFFTQTVVRALGLGEKGTEASFNDINTNQSYFGAIAVGLEYGIINGYEDNTFRPQKNVTREEAAALVVRAMKISGLKIDYSEGELQQELEKFVDKEKIGKWAEEYVAICAKNGMIIGNEKGEFMPKETMTKAQLAAIMQRMLERAELI
ncbi:MAG: InlB B-repeat-containing protein, partial [Clostridia bacterium]|nr:InlB B-repeat-containing protein [Clostridia bacterium]